MDRQEMEREAVAARTERRLRNDEENVRAAFQAAPELDHPMSVRERNADEPGRGPALLVNIERKAQLFVIAQGIAHQILGACGGKRNEWCIVREMVQQLLEA